MKNDALLFSIAKVSKYLEQEIERLQAEEESIKNEIDRITNECSRQVQPLHSRKRAIGEQLVTYCKTYNFLKGVCDDDETEGTVEQDVDGSEQCGEYR